MPRNSSCRPCERRLQFEEFEKRLVMSAQAVTQLLPELDLTSPAIMQQAVSFDHLSTTQASDLAAEYGLDGSGQTVAVIDSGIAWDHNAFGSGFGAGHQVVGGWDFAENDANPYDDGPAGYHGTHIAGIIGSQDDQYRGVAPGADLVGLRVFGDNGEGDLDWVEQALQWVHEHKDDFANPITTVNLSIGTSWNDESNPEWANLEDEFAQLEADGMFISVAAGNSFLTFGQPGLSYPAVSDHVVPVSSHDAEGNLSDFAQRDQGVLVAPGESIRSAVPDHLFGGTDGDRFLGSSGTSMSAPYIAGASAVLRQANEFMGVTDITQDLLYQQFRDSADQIVDSVTGGYYYRVNLDAALAAVIQDRHSDSSDAATNAGELFGDESIEGTIGRVDDVDTFEFTAGFTGRLTLNFEVTDDLVPLVNVDNASTYAEGHSMMIDVVKGQQVQFSVASADGTGHYQIQILADTLTGGGTDPQASENSGPATNSPMLDWGAVVSKEFRNQTIEGESVFRLQAMRDGYLTIEAAFNPADSLAIEIYDSQMRLINASGTHSGELRLDVQAQVGETYFVKAIGQAESVDFRAANLVSLTSGLLTVNGTNLDDTISVSVSDQFAITVNGMDYQFDLSLIHRIDLFGHQGSDSIELALAQDDDRVSTRQDGVTVNNARFRVNAHDFNTTSVLGGGGDDMISMIGSNAQDSVLSGQLSSRYWTQLSGQNFSSRATGFELVHVVATEGENVANLSGSAGNDRFITRGERSWLRMPDATVMVDGFGRIDVHGSGGNDLANLYDSEGDDQFVLNPHSATLGNDRYQIQIDGFQRINAFSEQGEDAIKMIGSAGNEVFDHRSGVSILNGSGFTHWAEGFASVVAVSRGGNDFAQVVDTAGDDVFFGRAGHTQMRSSEATIGTHGFKQVNLIASNGGHDRALLKATDGDDVVHSDPDELRLSMSNGRTNRVVGVDQVELDLLAGLDLSFLTGSENREHLEASYSRVELESTLQLLSMTNVEHTQFNGKGGGDSVTFEDMGELDLLESLGSEATAYLKDHTVVAEEFSLLEANTVDGAMAEYDLEAVDYLYLLRGNWSRT